jgi:phosphocarrier protein
VNADGADGPVGGASAPHARLVATLPIINQRGLHARASRKFAELALSFQSRITVRREDGEADGGSIMDLMMLAAGVGSEIEVEIEGPDAPAAMKALERLVADRFGEDY